MVIMTIIERAVIFILMAFAIVGAIGAMRDESKGIGREFVFAFEQLGVLFIPLAAVGAALPFLEKGTLFLFGPLFNAIGADPAIAACLFIGPDNGAYLLTNGIAQSTETWMMCVFTSYMIGPVVCYTIPLAFSLLDIRDRKYLGLGIMAGVLSVPFAVLVCSILLKVTNTPVRPTYSNDAPSDTFLNLDWGTIFINLVPLIIFCIILALMLKFLIDITLKIFLVFGKVLDVCIKAILVICIVEYFTGIFSKIFGSWGFEPIIADEVNPFRALETAGYIALMLCGAYPMIYLIKKYCSAPIQKVGSKFGFSSIGSTAALAAAAEQVAMLGIMKEMPPTDKVKVVAFSVCGSWILGAHISFTANFNPTLLGPILIGKLVGCIIAVLIANWIAVPAARKLEMKERAEGIIAEGEYAEMEAELENYYKKLDAKLGLE